MPKYLVEPYVPGSSVEMPPELEDGPAQGVPRDGERVRHVQSALIPGDEICLSLFEAPSEESLAQALDTGGLPFVRIVEALVQGGGDTGRRIPSRPPWSHRRRGQERGNVTRGPVVGMAMCALGPGSDAAATQFACVHTGGGWTSTSRPPPPSGASWSW